MTKDDDQQPALDTTSDKDRMLPEYDFSRGVRSNQKRAETIRKNGYSVTIHHQDGSSTTKHIPPGILMSEEKTYNWQGDRISGDKVSGDKVSGDKVGGDKVMGDKITHYHSQNLAQAAKDIKDLLDQLDKDYDRTTPTGQAMISAKAIESIEKNPTLKARIINALKEGGTTALESAIDHPAVKPVVAMLKGFMNAK